MVEAEVPQPKAVEPEHENGKEEKAEEHEVSDEEIKHMMEQLDKVKEDPEKAIKLLKVIEQYKITGKQLKETNIGRMLQKVQDKPNPEGESDDKLETLELLRKIKKGIMVKWKEVYEIYKKGQKSQDRPVQLVSQKSMDSSQVMYSSVEVHKAPYLPKGQSMYETESPVRNKIALNLITML